MEGMEGKISGHQKITQSNCFRNELKKKKKHNQNNKDKHLVIRCQVILSSPTASRLAASLVPRGRSGTKMATNR